MFQLFCRQLGCFYLKFKKNTLLLMGRYYQYSFLLLAVLYGMGKETQCIGKHIPNMCLSSFYLNKLIISRFTRKCVFYWTRNSLLLILMNYGSNVVAICFQIITRKKQWCFLSNNYIRTQLDIHLLLRTNVPCAGSVPHGHKLDKNLQILKAIIYNLTNYFICYIKLEKTFYYNSADDAIQQQSFTQCALRSSDCLPKKVECQHQKEN